MSRLSYNIITNHFEGPFELLLFFIERDELDIHDIPIAKITKDFLDYLHQLELLDIDIASEFILVAATLMNIKAKLLLPRIPLDEEGNDIDPRAELTQHLLEYKKYKEISAQLRNYEEASLSYFYRGNKVEELKQISHNALQSIELESLTLYKLMNAFYKVMERFEDKNNRPVQTIAQYKFTIATQKSYLIKKISPKRKMNFVELFSTLSDKIEAIVTFIALLELLSENIVDAIKGVGVNNFWIQKL